MKKTLIISATVLAAATGLALSSCGANPGNDTTSAPGQSASSSSMPGMSGDSMNSTPATPATESGAGTHNTADTMFARMMVPHHEDAITMSDALLAKEGIDSRVSALAERIKAEQTPEIDQLTASLQAWNEPADMPGGTMNGMNGSMGGDMQALDAAQGTEAATVFLDQMIIHHTSAIAMAEKEAANGSDPDTVKLAESIVSSQKAQIQQMKDLLTTL